MCIHLLRVAIVLIFVVIAGSACGTGSDNTLTPDDYFKSVEAVIQRFGEDADAIVQGHEEDSGPVDSFIRDLVPIWRLSAKEFRDLRPPAELETHHNAAVEARQVYADTLENYLSTGTPPNDSGVDDERGVHPCLLLQRIADASRINADLECLMFRMEGYSMEPAISHGRYMGIREYGGDEAPIVGDIVAFSSPTSPDRDFFKRIIGLPGDVIEIDEATATVSVNGEVLEESYVNGSTGCSAGCSWVVPPADSDESRAACGSDACYFVLGDNRQNSSDSRQGWFVPAENIIGRVTKVHEDTVVPRW